MYAMMYIVEVDCGEWEGKLIINYDERPQELRRSEVSGVFAGGCVVGGEGSRFRAKAHTHTEGKFNGWVCFLSPKRLACRELVLHELAHVLTTEGHTDNWRKKLIEIGGTIDEVPGLLKSYHKRKRK